jgi:hypothetical protein
MRFTDARSVAQTRISNHTWVRGYHTGILEPSASTPISASLFNNWKEVVECLIVIRR